MERLFSYTKAIRLCTLLFCLACLKTSITFAQTVSSGSYLNETLLKIETEQQYRNMLSNLKRPVVISFHMGGCRPSLYYNKYVMKYMLKNYSNLADYYTITFNAPYSEKDQSFPYNLVRLLNIKKVPLAQVIYNNHGDGFFTNIGFVIEDSIKYRNELKELILRATREMNPSAEVLTQSTTTTILQAVTKVPAQRTQQRTQQQPMQSQPAGEAIYNLDGQRVDTIQPGVYVKNGKKFVKR